MINYDKLENLLFQLSNLKTVHWKTSGEGIWTNKVLRFLKKELGEESDFYKEFHDDVYGPYIAVAGTPDNVIQQRYLDRLNGYERRLKSFIDELKEDESSSNEKSGQQTKANKDKQNGDCIIFIIHGHDEAAIMQLQKLLKDEWNLNTLVLRDEPSRGRTIIEKFEQEAQKTCFAFALWTPDDIVKSENESYFQVRPNTMFELGWFYGRFGRDKVCILFKKGTKIPSDLNGINTIEFEKTVHEKFLEIRAELKGAGII
jgi:predicted nucleotide-binding protein